MHWILCYYTEDTIGQDAAWTASSTLGGFALTILQKLRQSWNKHNLYNLARMTGDQPSITSNKTFFQQKWDAKSRTRAYHGDHIPEKKWVRLFSRHLRSVVNMPPAYLGNNDGSEQAAGRGSGVGINQETAEKYWPQKRTFRKEDIRITHPRQQPTEWLATNRLISSELSSMTPYMQMTYAPLERRLDTAIFRALFASSVRQARQFILHGAVKVNGKKVRRDCSLYATMRDMSHALTATSDGPPFLSAQPGRHVPGGGRQGPVRHWAAEESEHHEAALARHQGGQAEG